MLKALAVVSLLLLSWLPVADVVANEPRSYPEDVAGWTAVTIPPKAARADRLAWLYAASYSDLEWQVKLAGDHVAATAFDASRHEKQIAAVLPFVPKVDRYTGAQAARKVSDGWLVAFNRGEWGGALYWFDTNGTSNYRISAHQVVDFFMVGERVHAVEGMAHMTISRGSVIAVDRVDGRWQATTAHPLPAAPYAVASAADGTAYIVLSDALVALRSGRLETLVEDTVWGWFYPNCVVLGPDGSLYVGMRQFVARISLADGSLEFLVPELRALNRLPVEQEQRIRRQAVGG
ncbi:MAG: hypothetical protein DCF27_14020 [Lysobacteraceae bacterium]|nr:MAG: hypothetical protein DCF27_14020 [Xanthomonadaceae bacterium]